MCGGLGAALAACSVITGLNADYTRQDEGSGADADAAVSADGPVSTGDGGPDAAPVTDATADGGRFCEQYGDAADVAFCWDFEGSIGNPTIGFAGSETTGNGTIGNLTIVEDGGTNGSLGLLATLEAPTASGQAYLRQQLGDGGAGDSFDAWSYHSMEFDFVIQSNSINVVTIGSIGFGSSLKVTGLATYWDGVSKTQMDISSPPGSPGGAQVLAPLGTWMHAQIELTRPSAGQPYVTKTQVHNRGTATGGEVTNPSVDTFAGGPGYTELLVGAYFSSQSSGSIAVRIDDILYKRRR
jgi:hypothetical protein